MTFQGDPYRVLGLPFGAPLSEVKRRYRVLAKQFHPDSAGERALPRFLAIQAAYESLVGNGRQREGGRGARRPGGPAARAQGTAGSSRTWQADPDRARATRDAYRRRTSRPSEDAGDEAAGGTTGRPNRWARADRASAEPGRERPDRGAPRTGPGRAGPDGGRGAEPGGRGAAEPGDAARRRASRKATLGSTSYDDAPPFETTWEGGTWYGASSGTYWTINPKEYADPRKHGPEYLQRARRAWQRHASGGATGIGDSDDAAAGTTGEAVEGAAQARGGSAGRRSDASASAGDASWSGAPTTSAGAPGGTVDAAGATAAREDATDTAAGATAAAAGATDRSAFGRRLLLALLAWPPIGLAAGGLYGELTGCGRFAASCANPDGTPFGLTTWLGQVAILGALVLLPRVARPAAAGTIGLLAAAIPVAIFLSAIGGSRDPTSASALLVALLALAWLAGVALQVSGRADPLAAVGRRVR